MEIRTLSRTLLTAEVGTHVTILEAERAGLGRRRALELVATEVSDAVHAPVLDLDFDRGGPWAGFRPFFELHLGTLRRDHPKLVERHAAELAYLVPTEKRSLGARNQTLTDLAPAEEKVRNYPADRAYRVVHGLIELLEAYKAATDPDRPWIFFFDHFDRASHIGRRLISEWVRRRAEAMCIHLVLAVDPGKAADAASAFERSRTVHLAVEPVAEPEVDREAARRQAIALEQAVGQDKGEIEIHVVELLNLFRLAGDDRKVFQWQCWGLDIYNSLGFYEDALRYGEVAWKAFDDYRLEHEDLRWALFVKLFMSNVGLQRGDEAWRITEVSKMLERDDVELPRRAQLYYLLAMLHVRYFQPRDLDKGEEYLDKGLADLEAARADISAEDYYFFAVFNRNGLALVRHFQGRFQDAIDLCQDGYELLQEHLSGDKHLLHRSVLLYNIGQVYAAIGENERAIEYYTNALSMDPTYSEYYNDRGSLYLRLGRHAEAKADYLRAIELSPPYHEVWTNLGQCFRHEGANPEAVRCYDRALDLEPSSLLAWIGRAQAHDALGQLDAALADYDAALVIDPEQWDALGSRAVVRFQMGNPTSALDDLDRAIELAPNQADLYHNRSVARAEVGLTDGAVDDLRTYLRLAPDASDRDEVTTRLDELTRAA